MHLSKQKAREWIDDTFYPPMWRAVGFAVGGCLLALFATVAITAWHGGHHLTWPPAFSADPHGPPPPIPPY